MGYFSVFMKNTLRYMNSTELLPSMQKALDSTFSTMNKIAESERQTHRGRKTEKLDG